MAKYTIEDTTLTNIANAIRTKGGTTATLTPAEMVTAIDAISAGGGTGGDINVMEATLTSNSSTLNKGYGVNVFDYVDSVEDILCIVVRTRRDYTGYNTIGMYMKGYGFIEETTMSPFSSSDPGVALGAVFNPQLYSYSKATVCAVDSTAFVIHKASGMFYPRYWSYNSNNYSNQWATLSNTSWNASDAHIWMLYKQEV